MGDLGGDVVEDAPLETDRRHRHALEIGGLGIAGDEVEDARDVAADRRIGGEEREVGIDARRDRMVVAGAEMDIGGERAGLAPHHQRQLGVGLELDEAVDHLRAGALEVARPADIGLLVEARLELDQRRHRLARLGRLGQRAHDRAVLGGAVERLLDRDHVGIARRLLQELHHHVEGFVGVMDDQVLLPDRGEAIAAMLADALGKARIVGHEFEIGPIDGGELRQLGEREHAVDHEHLVLGHRERAPHEAAQVRPASPRRARAG